MAVLISVIRMKVYVSRASGTKGLEALKKLEGIDFIFADETNSKETIKSCNAMIADVSIPSHGVGIEIGWADAFNVPVILISRKGSKLSSSLRFISKAIEYENLEDALPGIKNMLDGLQ